MEITPVCVRVLPADERQVDGKLGAWTKPRKFPSIEFFQLFALPCVRTLSFVAIGRRLPDEPRSAR